ncbi:MAG: hypothetical protein WAL91_07385, partial [Propionicimonas sp.]
GDIVQEPLQHFGRQIASFAPWPDRFDDQHLPQRRPRTVTMPTRQLDQLIQDPRLRRPVSPRDANAFLTVTALRWLIVNSSPDRSGGDPS